MSAEDFRDFAADNTIRLHGQMNPDFWKGTPSPTTRRACWRARRGRS